MGPLMRRVQNVCAMRNWRNTRDWFNLFYVCSTDFYAHAIYGMVRNCWNCENLCEEDKGPKAFTNSDYANPSIKFQYCQLQDLKTSFSGGTPSTHLCITFSRLKKFTNKDPCCIVLHSCQIIRVLQIVFLEFWRIYIYACVILVSMADIHSRFLIRDHLK